MWYADIALVKLTGYAGRIAVPRAIDQGTSSSHQGPDESALLIDIRHRCDVLLTKVFECGWHELDDKYIDECTCLP